MIKVYHIDRSTDRPILVAEVDTNDLDVAYEKTNHIYSAWWENPEVTLVKESRSTSVGDFLMTDSGVFEVDRIGFVERMDFNLETA